MDGYGGATAAEARLVSQPVSGFIVKKIAACVCLCVCVCTVSIYGVC